MAFVSKAFICFVFMISFFYFCVKKKYRWIVLLVGSYLFYWINSRSLVAILFLMTAVTFGVGKIIDTRNQKCAVYLTDHGELSPNERKSYKQKMKKTNKSILILGVLIDLCILLFLKYFNFFSENVNAIFGWLKLPVEVPALNLLIPIGLSFYTLQAIAYMTDIYRGKYRADSNFAQFMLFMSYFPQIVQGPIARHDQLAEQLYEGHNFDYKRCTFGLQLVLWGFMKKLIIADRLAIPVNAIFDHYENYSGLLVLLAAVGYSLQVYADFSGGMDIARGVSQILGIELQLNFKQPYFARSIEEFWRRWHITLGAWMKDYVFYPLSLSKFSGNIGKKTRKIFGSNIGKKIPSFIAMFIVYFLVGFWHGPEWKYMVYGIWNGIFIMSGILLEEAYSNTRKRLRINEEKFAWKFFQMLRTFILCAIGRFFSRANNLPAAFFMITASFKGIYNIAFLLDQTLIELGLSTADWILLCIMLLILLGVDLAHEKGIYIRQVISEQAIVFRWLIYYAAIFAIIIFGMYGPGYDSAAFIYQQF